MVVLVVAVLDFLAQTQETILARAQQVKGLLAALRQILGLTPLALAAVVVVAAVLVPLRQLGRLVGFFVRLLEMAAWAVKYQSVALQRLMAAAVALEQTTTYQVSKSLLCQAEAVLAIERLLRMDRRLAFPVLR
jgi:hypothetical protein